MAVDQTHTFILRLSSDAAGRVRGVLERVRTGEKVKVEELDALGPLLGQMLRAGKDDQIDRTEESP
jgi:hypothetical protein